MHNELVVLLNKYKHKHTMRNNGVMRWTGFFILKKYAEKKRTKYIDIDQIMFAWCSVLCNF